MELTQEQIDYFWARVDKSGGVDACWNWTFSCNSKGYGQATINKKYWNTHVLSLTLTAGPKPADKPYACHNCKQNKKCCNPKHLRWDTAEENACDKIKDGTMPTGELHRQAKLTELQVKEIRAKYATGKYLQKQLADEYGVHHSHISDIVNRKLWKHI